MQRSVYKPTIKRRDMDAVLSCLVEETIGPGEHTEALSTLMAEYLGMAGGIALREFRSAVELALDSIGLEPGDAVLVSALAPFVYHEILERRGMDIRICDVNPETANIAPESAGSESLSTAKLTIVTSPCGIPLDPDEVEIPDCALLEDVSRLLGAERRDRLLLAPQGRYVVVGLEEDGIVTAGGGALLLASDRRGVNSIKTASERLTKLSSLGNLNASLATIQLKHIDEFRERRLAIADGYVRAISSGPHRAPTAPHLESLSHVIFPVVLSTGIKEVTRYARKKGVATLPLFTNSILSYSRLAAAEFPHAHALALRSLLFPLYPMLKREEVDLITRVQATLP